MPKGKKAAAPPIPDEDASGMIDKISYFEPSPDQIIGPLKQLAIPMADLTLNPTNPRTHGEESIEAIKASLKRFGQRKPIVVQREGMVVRAGNGTLTAAQELGWEMIAALVIDEVDSEARAFGLVDNRTAELSEWVFEAVAVRPTNRRGVSAEAQGD